MTESPRPYWEVLRVRWWWRTPWMPKAYTSTAVRGFAALCSGPGRGGPFPGRTDIHPLASTPVEAA
jgi:hypothetical protein